MTIEYEDALKKANAELSQLLEEKYRLDVRIHRLKRTVDSLTDLASGVDEGNVALAQILFEEGVGLTEGLRIILKESSRPMKAPALRDQLKHRGYDMASYASELTAIHNTVKRMVRQGEVVEHNTASGVFEGWTLKPQSTGLK